MSKLDGIHPDPWQLVAELRVENERLRAVLQAIEWMNEFDNDAPRWCPWCDRWQSDGHSPDCQRQAALDAAGE